MWLQPIVVCVHMLINKSNKADQRLCTVPQKRGCYTAVRSKLVLALSSACTCCLPTMLPLDNSKVKTEEDGVGAVHVAGAEWKTVAEAGFCRSRPSNDEDGARRRTSPVYAAKLTGRRFGHSSSC